MQPLYGGIALGDRVRSYDFLWRRDCYVEGVVETVIQRGCQRYRIKIARRVWGGNAVDWTPEFPDGHCEAPVNGLPSWLGGVTSGVVRLDADGKEVGPCE